METQGSHINLDRESAAELTDPQVIDLYEHGLISRVEADVLDILAHCNDEQGGNLMPDELNPQRAESGAERQATEVVRGILRDDPLPEPPHQEAFCQEGIYPLTSREAQQLHCIAFIRDGQVIPIMDLPQQPLPRTPGEKMRIFALATRTILDGLLEALEFWEDHRREREGDQGDEGGTCLA